MMVVWFKNRPKPIALTPDGRLNLVPFKLDPDTIAINGIEGLVAKDSKSEGTFEQVLSMGLFQATAGSREDPLIVEGQPLGGRGITGTEDLQPLVAYVKDQMRKSRSVRLSNIDTSEWGTVQRSAGLSLKAYPGKFSGLKLQSATPYKWGTEGEPSQADQYLDHIRSHIQEVVDDVQYCMYDARRNRKLLTISGMQAELGFSIKGTTDAALVEQQCVTAGLPATGLRWLWELKRQLHGPTSGVLAETVPGAVPSSSTSKYDSQPSGHSLQSKPACQAMAALLLANIHAPHLKPAVTLTDLRDKHTIFWLDGSEIIFYAAPDASTAWALTKALLVRDPDGHNADPSADSIPESLQPLAKRQKLDIHGMHSSGGELAQLAALSDSMSSYEYKLSTAACMLKQLFHLPAFCSEARSFTAPPFGMFI